MDNITVPELIGISGLVSTILSIVAFWLGRKQAITVEGKTRGQLESDLGYLKESVGKLTSAFDTLTTKLELQDEKREKDYRAVLVELAELKARYSMLNTRVEEISKYLGGGSK